MALSVEDFVEKVLEDSDISDAIYRLWQTGGEGINEYEDAYSRVERVITHQVCLRRRREDTNLVSIGYTRRGSDGREGKHAYFNVWSGERVPSYRVSHPRKPRRKEHDLCD